MPIWHRARFGPAACVWRFLSNGAPQCCPSAGATRRVPKRNAFAPRGDGCTASVICKTQPLVIIRVTSLLGGNCCRYIGLGALCHRFGSSRTLCLLCHGIG